MFWREDRLRQIASPLVAQVPKCVDLREDSDIGKAKVLDTLVALMGTVGDDNQLKKINLDVLMHTRSEDARVRLFALQCAEALWTTHGTKLMGTSFKCSGSTNMNFCAHLAMICRIRLRDLHLHRRMRGGRERQCRQSDAQAQGCGRRCDWRTYR